MIERVSVELVLATRDRQLLLPLEVDVGATVADVISHSSIATEFPGLNVEEMTTGIWGKLVSKDHVVKDGDRIELYRPLQIDPREARRKRALAGRTMGRDPGD